MYVYLVIKRKKYSNFQATVFETDDYDEALIELESLREENKDKQVYYEIEKKRA